MKKIVLSLTGVLAATAFAPEASAIPSFARQTGMACSACHQQHYPVLNQFGQAFKASGYTMMGAQGKVEGEHLSIPDVLNASMLLKARYQKSNGAEKAGELSGETTNSGQWQIPDEFSLFFGGRVGETGSMKLGFMFEGNTAGSMLVAGFKMPIVMDLDSVKLMAIPYLTDALGTSYGFEQSSTGAVRGVRWAEHRKEISAQQYIGTDGAATGFALVAVADIGYVNLSRWSPNFTASGTTAAKAAGANSAAVDAADHSAIQMSSNYVRVAATPTIAGWATHIGVQSWSGDNYISGTTSTLGYGGNSALISNVATAADFQAHGQVGDNDMGIYATYAVAPKSTADKANLFNTSTAYDKTAMTIGADYSVIPHTLHIGAAYRSATNNANKADNAITGMVVYDLTQNVALHVNHSMYSGTAYDAAGSATALTTFLLEAAW